MGASDETEKPADELALDQLKIVCCLVYRGHGRVLSS